MKRMWGVVALTTVTSVVATLLATWWVKGWNLPEWVKDNSGPWVAVGALVTFLGAGIGLTVQASLSRADRAARTADAENARQTTVNEAKADREAQTSQLLSAQKAASSEAEFNRLHSLEVAKQEREEQEARAQRQWFREKRYAAYVDFIHTLNEWDNDRPSGEKRRAFAIAQVRASTVSDPLTDNVISHIGGLAHGFLLGQLEGLKADFTSNLLIHAEMWLTNILSEKSEKERQLSQTALLKLYGDFAKKIDHPLHAQAGRLYESVSSQMSESDTS